MSNLALRLVTAAVGLAALFTFLFALPRPAFYFFVLAAILVAAYEYFLLAFADDRPGVFVGVAACAAVSLALFFARTPLVWAIVLAAVPIAGLVYVLFRPALHAQGASRAAHFALGVPYVGVLLTFVAFLDQPPFGPAWVILALSVTWIGDTTAYFVGRAIGKHPLYPAVSPKKTWEGAVGGLLGSVGAAVVAKVWYLPQIGLVDALALGAGAAALEQIGDLCESLLKRGAGVKDIGGLLPGHGGILDRIDGLLFSAPYIYLYATVAR